MCNDATRLYSLVLPVRWGDMDALGHVNNAVYFTYLEQTRVAWLESHNLAGALLGDAQGPVIVNASCTFHRPVVYLATLRITLAGSAPGRSSFDTAYEIRDETDPSILYLTANARVVWVDHDAGRSIPLPEALRTLLPKALE